MKIIKVIILSLNSYISIAKNNKNEKIRTNNLNSIDFSDKKVRINSPISLKALLAMGLQESNLFEISKKEYIDKHPELKRASISVQNIRYEHYNNRRYNLIEEAKKMRKEMIDEMDKEKEKDNKEEGPSTQDEIIKKELEKLELIKMQQIGEIKNLIEYFVAKKLKT